VEGIISVVSYSISGVFYVSMKIDQVGGRIPIHTDSPTLRKLLGSFSIVNTRLRTNANSENGVC